MTLLFVALIISSQWQISITNNETIRILMAVLWGVIALLAYTGHIAIG